MATSYSTAHQTRCAASLVPRLGASLSLKDRVLCGRSLPRAVRSRKQVNYLRRPAAQLVPEPSEENEEGTKGSLVRKLSGPVAALVVCALLSGSVLPEEALAARSGGRMGGSSFRSRAAPSMPRGGRSIRQYNYYSSPSIAPPLVGGYGYGLGGYSMMPSFFFPIGFGGFFNIFIMLFILSAVANAVRNFQRRDDDRDDFDDF